MHSTDITISLVGSYPTFSPLPVVWRLFSSALSDPHESLPVRKRNALCCPDFPLASKDQRQAEPLFSVTKIRIKVEIQIFLLSFRLSLCVNECKNVPFLFLTIVNHVCSSVKYWKKSDETYTIKGFRQYLCGSFFECINYEY